MQNLMQSPQAITHIGLFGQIFAAAIVAVIVDDEEMVDAHLPVVAQEKWQTDTFVAQGGKDQDRIAGEAGGTVCNHAQFAAFSKRSEKPALARKAQLIF